MPDFDSYELTTTVGAGDTLLILQGGVLKQIQHDDLIKGLLALAGLLLNEDDGYVDVDGQVYSGFRWPGDYPGTPYLEITASQVVLHRNSGSVAVGSTPDEGGVWQDYFKAAAGTGTLVWAAGTFGLWVRSADGNTSLFHVKPDDSIHMPNLPTSDPAVAGQLWSDYGLLALSGGLPAGDRLLYSGVVDMNTVTPQDLYTVPAGKTLAVSRAFFHGGSPGTLADGDTGQARLLESAGGQIIGSVSVASATAANSFVQLVISISGRTIPAGAKVQFAPSVAYGSEQTCVVDLFGYFVNA